MNENLLDDLLDETDINDTAMNSPTTNNESKKPTVEPKPQDYEDPTAVNMLRILIQSKVSTPMETDDITMEKLPAITKQWNEQEKTLITHGLEYIPDSPIKAMLNALIITPQHHSVMRSNHIIPNKRLKAQVPDQVEWKHNVYTKNFTSAQTQVYGYQSSQGLTILLSMDPNITSQLKHTIIMTSVNTARAALVLEQSTPDNACQIGVIKLMREVSKRGIRFLILNGNCTTLCKFKQYTSDINNHDGRLLVLNTIYTTFNKL